MNTEREILEAYDDYRRTGFGGWPWPDDAPVHAGTPAASPATATGGSNARIRHTPDSGALPVRAVRSATVQFLEGQRPPYDLTYDDVFLVPNGPTWRHAST